MVQLAISIVCFVVVVWFIGMILILPGVMAEKRARARGARRESERKPKKSVQQMMLEAEFPNHNWNF